MDFPFASDLILERYNNIVLIFSYGIIEAFHLGRLPSNAQIDQTRQYVIDHSPVHVDKLSLDGKKLVQDTRDIIETACLIVQEKNADELFQQFVWHMRDVDKEGIKGGVTGLDLGKRLTATPNKVCHYFFLSIALV